jgi:Tfp pilus assembly protein PilX
MLQAQRINIKSEKGIALILALILMTLIFLLTLSAFEMVTVNTQIADNQIRDLQALYVADAGIDHAICELRIGTTLANKSCVDGNYLVVIDPTPASNITEYSIASTATMTNGATRSVIAEVKRFGSPSSYTVVITSWKEIL